MINGKIIKVCGMREAENIQDVESIEGIDMLGFIFYPKSPPICLRASGLLAHSCPACRSFRQRRQADNQHVC